MQTQADESPYLSLRCKADLVFDYETNNMKVEEKDDLNSKIYYHDPKSRTYSNLNITKRNSELPEL